MNLVFGSKLEDIKHYFETIHTSFSSIIVFHSQFYLSSKFGCIFIQFKSIFLMSG
jgi:hypothetical protein